MYLKKTKNARYFPECENKEMKGSLQNVEQIAFAWLDQDHVLVQSRLGTDESILRHLMEIA